MSKNMLGNVLLPDFQGPRNDLETKVASEDGESWLHELNRFLRKEPCWVKGVVQEQEVPDSALITRTARVNRTRSPKEAMIATGRTPCLNDKVLATMPKGIGDTVTMMFYCPGRTIEAGELEAELAKDGFKLDIDPVGQAAINEAYPKFADKYPNGNQWQDADGNYCYVTFLKSWYGGREVHVNRRDSGHNDFWWFPVLFISAPDPELLAFQEC